MDVHWFGCGKTNAYNPPALRIPTASSMRERLGHGGWDDDEDDDRIEPLTSEQASSLRARHPSISPWRVVAAQAVVGVALAALAWSITGQRSTGASALYGAAAAVLPGALMALASTRRLPAGAAAYGAVRLLSWSFVKIAVTVALLWQAPKLLQPLSWPALLAALVLCIQVYWFALLWRGR